MKILCTGAAGQLGQCFQHIQVEFPQFQFTFTDREDLDITDMAQLDAFCRQIQYDIIINCAAYTAVDAAENEKDKAMLINESAAHNLASIALKHNTHLIHISTDYVFHNNWNKPLSSDAPRTPQSEYGISKLAGEKKIENSGCNYTIIRTSWLYAQYAHNFLKTMSRLISERSELSIVYDQIGTPTYGIDLARFVLHILSHKYHHKHQKDSINFSNSGVGSWYDFALLIKKHLVADCNILPILTADYPLPAPRPSYSVFNLDKVIKQYGYTPRCWQAAVYECLSELNMKNN